MTAVHDVVVIGGGHNGLVAAGYLAQKGLDVLVVEANTAIGGMTATAASIPGAPDHRINHCALDVIFLHATPIAADLRLKFHGYQEVQVDPPIVYFHPDGASIAFWQNPARTVSEIRKLSPRDGDAYAELVADLAAMLDVALPVLATNPVRPRPAALGRAGWALLRHHRRLGSLAHLAVGSAAQAIDERFRHPIIRDALAAAAGIAGPITAEGSGLNLMALAFYHRFPTTRPIGGTQALPDALVRGLEAAGGHVRTASPVAEILVSGGRATGVRLNSGERIEAKRAVLAACDPRQALGKLLPAGTFSPKLEARVAHIPVLRDGWTPLRMDIALDAPLRLDRYERARGDGVNLRRPATITGSFDDTIATYRQAAAGHLPTNPVMWMTVPSGADPSQAPPGQDTLYLWAIPVPVDPLTPWSDLAPEAAKWFLTMAGQYYDGIDGHVIAERVETPGEFQESLHVTNGCVLHTDFTMLRSGPLRPGLGLAGYRTPVEGLFLGSAGSHPSPGVTGLPGRLAAREILRHRPREGRNV